MKRHTTGDLAYYTFDSLHNNGTLVHAISTRHGGVSPAPFDTLNLSHSTGDAATNVSTNIARLHNALGLDASASISAKQAQSEGVAMVGARQRGTRVADVDALLTNEPDIPLLLRFADCVPILFYDPAHRAMGIAHAGWRGTVLKIATRTARAMFDEFGTRPRDLIACIAPSIGPCCYRVGDDVIARVRAAFDNADELLIPHDGDIHLDLWQANAAQLRSEVEMLRGIGVNTRIVSAAELRELQPAARIDDIALAAYEPDAGYADPVAATQTLAARAKDLGVTFKTGTYVKSIRVDHDRVTGVDTNVGLIETLTVVVMAGPWSDRLLKPLNVELGLDFRRAEVAFFERPAELKVGHAAFIDTITGAHFRPHTFGLTMGGLTAPQPGSLKSPDQFDESVSQEAAADVQQRIAARLPAMTNARFTRGHTGIYDMTADGHAVLGRAPAIHGLVIAAGFSGTGFALAPAVGQCISELIADGEARTVDLEPFRLERFNNSH